MSQTHSQRRHPVNTCVPAWVTQHAFKPVTHTPSLTGTLFAVCSFNSVCGCKHQPVPLCVHIEGLRCSQLLVFIKAMVTWEGPE